MEYKIIFDNGKPYEEEYKNISDVEKALKIFYKKNKDSDYPFTAYVYQNNVDITDSFIIEQIIADIIVNNIAKDMTKQKFNCVHCEDGQNLIRGYECLHCGNTQVKYSKKV